MENEGNITLSAKEVSISPMVTSVLGAFTVHIQHVLYTCVFRLRERERAEFVAVQEMGGGCTWMFQRPSQM